MSPWHRLPLPSDPNRQPYEWNDTQLTVEDRTQINWFCGVEVHKRNTVVAFYGIFHEHPILGPVVSFDNSATGRQEMLEFAKQFDLIRVLMETTGIFHYTIGWAFEQIFPTVQVIVMNARVLKHYLRRIRQNDEIDATNLAQVARYEELLQWSYLPTPHMAILREYVRQRGKAVGEVVKLKNRIKKIFDMFGLGWEFDFDVQWHIELLQAFCHQNRSFGQFLDSHEAELWQKWIKIHQEDFRIWRSIDLPNEARQQILFLFQQLTLKKCTLSAIETVVRKQVGQDPAIRPQLDLILDAPGLGEFGAFEFVTEIGRIQRFPSEKFFIPYAGVGPSGKTSGVRVRESKKQQVVEKDKPNPYNNPRLKCGLMRASGVICKLAREGNSQDRVVLYARKLIDRGFTGLKLCFKVAAKLARCLFHCLAKNVAYLPQDLKPSSSSEGPKLSRRKRETIMKRILKVRAEDAWETIHTITSTLLSMGVSQATVDQLILPINVKGQPTTT